MVHLGASISDDLDIFGQEFVSILKDTILSIPQESRIHSKSHLSTYQAKECGKLGKLLAKGLCQVYPAVGD